MPWDLNGNSGIGANNYLGTRNNAALIVRTNTDGAPPNLEEIVRFTPSSGAARGRVGIGTTTPQRALHVEADEIHSGGVGAGFSFASRQTGQFVSAPAAGERWVWYASNGLALLWSGNDKLAVTPGGAVGVGTTTPQRLMHVEGTEIHSGGAGAGFSFASRQTGQFVSAPAAGERWVWYASNGLALLWSGNDKLAVTPGGRVGVGTTTPQRLMHVEGTEIHSGGAGAGLSSGNRETQQLVENPAAGERWAWYASGGVARLWSGNDKVTVAADGTLTVTGLTVTGPNKQFRISHPLDPAHRFLVHACIEGPENGVYYRGSGRLDRGHARIELPEYFEALVRPYGRTVALTACCEGDEPISVLAASNIVNGSFTVRAADDRNPRQSFYWEVKAVRADIAPLETEQDKAQESDRSSPQGIALVGERLRKR